MSFSLSSKGTSAQLGRYSIGDVQVCANLQIFPPRLACYCGRKELLSLRTLCRGSPSVSLAGAVNSDAALLTFQLADRSLRGNFDLVERRVCHSSSLWRKGFSRHTRREREAAFWICRGISRIMGEELPKELERLIATFCNNPCFRWVALDPRQLSSLNSLPFHWHRGMSQGATTPQRAVQVAWRILTNSGALILNVGVGIRTKGERAFDSEGNDVTKGIYSETKLVQRSVRMLYEVRCCMGTQSINLGVFLQGTLAEDQALKAENEERDAQLARWRNLGYFVDADELDVRM